MSLNQNLTIRNTRWNPTTDRFEVLKNGSWVQSIRAFVNNIGAFVNGIFGLTHVDDVSPAIGYTVSNTFVVNGNNLVIPNVTQQNTCGSLLFEGIDLTQYSKLKVSTNISGHTNIEVNISGNTGTGYPYVTIMRGTGYAYLRVGVSSTNTAGYTDNYVAQDIINMQTLINQFITEITIE